MGRQGRHCALDQTHYNKLSSLNTQLVQQLAIHTFDNGVRVYEHHLLDIQRVRYRRRNVHEENEEDVFLATLVNVPSGRIFLNVGAAVGYYAILAKLKRPDLQVHAVEPLPCHIERFKENLALNGLRPEDIPLHEVAVSGNDETTARLLDASYGSRLLDPYEVTPKRVAWVKSIPLGEICREIASHIYLLQMDIQGLELQVLERFFARTDRSLIHTFLIGTHSERIHFSVIALLQRHGCLVTLECANPPHQPDGIVLAENSPQ